MKEIRIDREIEALLKRSDALMEGHFILSSGLHSDKYVQCAKFFQYPKFAEIAANKLKAMFEGEKIDFVIGGAFGGIIIAQELGRAFGVRSFFAERVDGKFTLRRGFEIKEGERCIIAEDVITTGKSIGEVIDLVSSHGAEIVGVASLVDRNREEPEEIWEKIEWLHSVVAEAFHENEIPEHLKDIPAVKPGSRPGI